MATRVEHVHTSTTHLTDAIFDRFTAWCEYDGVEIERMFECIRIVSCTGEFNSPALTQSTKHTTVSQLRSASEKQEERQAAETASMQHTTVPHAVDCTHHMHASHHHHMISHIR